MAVITTKKYVYIYLDKLDKNKQKNAKYISWWNYGQFKNF